MNFIESLDEKLFLFLNGSYVSWLDYPMILITGTLIWIPLYLFLLYAVIRARRSTFWITLFCLILLVVLTDQGSGVFKHLVARPRPCYDPSTSSLVRLLTGCGGQYGFFSAHASNCFGVATFMFLFFQRKLIPALMLFFWALLVSYSRIYVGKHFPGDILVGMIFGIMSGWIIYRLELWFQMVRQWGSLVRFRHLYPNTPL